MIWTEEENDKRQIDNLLNHEEQTCITCQWSNYKKGDIFFTCGHHLDNFTPNSYCSYHTDKNDKKLLEYYNKKKSKLKKNGK